VVVPVIRVIMRLLGWRIRITGLEHVPADGPVVIVANHVSYIDPLLVGLGIDRRGRMVRYLAKRELFDHWFTGPMVRGVDQIPVDRRGDAGAALRHGERAMAEGKLLVIFPEGTIHPSLDVTKGKTGAARLALACNVALMPAVAWGGQQVATKGKRIRPGFGTTHEVRFGPPLPYQPTDTVGDLTRRIMESLAELLEQAAAAHPADLGPPVLGP
jgi:1-acyl-sn-glycerol-3-phosphate acyltransferase